jgi:hypothetical protein
MAAGGAAVTPTTLAISNLKFEISNPKFPIYSAALPLSNLKSEISNLKSPIHSAGWDGLAKYHPV